MIHRKIQAFTLVELIVVIVILAILATIGFMSFGWYTGSARNSSRLSDMKLIDKSMRLYKTTESLFPLPDNYSSVSYSGAVLWNQGIFSTWAIVAMKRISHIPLDPLSGNHFTYSLTTNGQQYQIGGIAEAGLFSYTPTTSQSYAFGSEGTTGYVYGNYISYDVNASSGWNCHVISSPSIILSTLPAGDMTNGGYYNYVYTRSPHIPLSYSGSIDSITNPGNPFRITEVHEGCSISTLEELELYVAKLSTSYQQLSGIDKFKTVLFQANTREFQFQALQQLEDQGITVDPELKKLLDAPIVYRVFVDTFTNTDGTELVGSHVPAESESWVLTGSGNNSDYTIENNSLRKNGASTTLIHPIPFPTIGNADYEVAFDVTDFAGGTISTYLRYTDSNNYYRLDITSSGYQVSRRLAGSDTIFQNINDPITAGSRIKFGIAGDTLTLSVNDIEKENLVVGGITAVWNPSIFLHNNTARIDNFTLTYQ